MATFRTFPPHPLLDPHVRYYWTFNSPPDGRGRIERPVFSEVGTELIFNLGTPITIGDDSAESGTTFGDSLIMGPMTRCKWARSPGPCHLMGACFRPGSARAFIDAPVWQVADRSIEADNLMGKSVRTVFDRLRSGHSEPDKNLAVLDAFLLNRLERSSSRHRNDATAIQIIRHTRGQVNVGTIAMRLGTSVRQLERSFKNMVGVSPKRTCRIYRFVNVLEQIAAGSEENWATIALTCGYYDQAHMIREFKSFTGVSPEQYRISRPGLEQFISGDLNKSLKHPS